MSSENTENRKQEFRPKNIFFRVFFRIAESIIPIILLLFFVCASILFATFLLKEIVIKSEVLCILSPGCEEISNNNELTTRLSSHEINKLPTKKVAGGIENKNSKESENDIKNKEEEKEKAATILIYFVLLVAIVDITYLLCRFHFINCIMDLKLDKPNIAEAPESIFFHEDAMGTKAAVKLRQLQAYEIYNKQKKLLETYTYAKHLITAIIAILLLEVFTKIFLVHNPDSMGSPLAFLVIGGLFGTASILFVFAYWDRVIGKIVHFRMVTDTIKHIDANLPITLDDDEDLPNPK